MKTTSEKRQTSILDFSFQRNKRVKNEVKVDVQEGEDNKITEIEIEIKQETFSCPICEFDLTKFHTDARSVHINRCIDIPVKSPYVYESPKKEIKKEVKKKKSTTVKRKRNTKVKSEIETKAEIEIKTENQIETLEKPQPQPQPQPKKRRGKPKPPIPDMKILNFHSKPEDIIAVDAFCFCMNDKISVYLLTHFHSDHYGGICKSWDNGKLIICTLITGKLLKLKYKIPDERLFMIENYGVEHQIPDTNIKITAYDANHCPGAGIFVLECNGLRYLHCGDFRANKKMIDILKERYPSGFNKCYLDTTYDNPKYIFPPQELVINTASEFIRDKCVTYKAKQSRILEFFTNSKGNNAAKQFLIIVGTYSIGKERLALGIAEALDTGIYCTPEKKSIMETFGWESLSKRIVSDEDKAHECSVHLVAISKTRKDSMKEYLQKYSSHFKSAIVIRPTGWTFGYTLPTDTLRDSLERGFQHTSADEKGQSGVGVIHRVPVPYSEHSSYEELTMFRTEMAVKEWINTV